jgi:hypothetical protein
MIIHILQKIAIKKYKVESEAHENFTVKCDSYSKTFGNICHFSSFDLIFNRSFVRTPKFEFITLFFLFNEAQKEPDQVFLQIKKDYSVYFYLKSEKIKTIQIHPPPVLRALNTAHSETFFYAQLFSESNTITRMTYMMMQIKQILTFPNFQKNHSHGLTREVYLDC